MLFLRHQTKAFYRLPPANRRPDGKAEQHDGSLPPYLHQLRAKRLRASSFLRHRSFNNSHFIFHDLELDEDWKSNKRYAMESIQPQSLKSEEEEWRGRRVWGHVHNSYNGIWDFSQRKRENVEVKNILGTEYHPILSSFLALGLSYGGRACKINSLFSETMQLLRRPTNNHRQKMISLGNLDQ